MAFGGVDAGEDELAQVMQKHFTNVDGAEVVDRVELCRGVSVEHGDFCGKVESMFFPID